VPNTTVSRPAPVNGKKLPTTKLATQACTRIPPRTDDGQLGGGILHVDLRAWFAAFAVALVPTARASAHPPAELQDVSLIRLIANPEAFDGKRVRVIAFLNLEFEGNALYVSRADSENNVSKNGVWIDVPEQVRKDARQYSDRYVLVEGVFSAKDHGHLGVFSGALGKVSRVEVWSRRGKPKRWPNPQ
jgi:hypothetical protein